MDELTSEQKTQLQTWAGQRDAFLSEISALQTQSESLQAKNKDLANSNTAIESLMNEVRGRIAELKIRESELFSVIPKEVAFLESKKSGLEAQIEGLNKEIKLLTEQKNGLETAMAFHLETFTAVNERAALLGSIVSHVTEISGKNVTTIENLVIAVKKSMQDLISANEEAIRNANIITKEMPAVFLEVQRKSLIREKINKQQL